LLTNQSQHNTRLFTSRLGTRPSTNNLYHTMHRDCTTTCCIQQVKYDISAIIIAYYGCFISTENTLRRICVQCFSLVAINAKLLTLQHTRPCYVKLSYWSVDPQILHRNVHQVDHVPNRPTNPAVTTTMLPLRLCGGKPSVAVTRELRYGPSQLRVNDDDYQSMLSPVSHT